MRLLFLSNFFPPDVDGGYEQWCHEVALELGHRGHQVRVLTAAKPTRPVHQHECGIEVLRALPLEVDAGLARTALRLAVGRVRPGRPALDAVRRAVTEFEPDAALIWGMWNVPRCVPAKVEDLLGTRVAYYLCDYWLSLPSAYVQQWQAPARRALATVPKRLMAGVFLTRLGHEPQPPLRLENPICVSRAVRERLVEAGINIGHAQVVYGGTRVDEFSELARGVHNQQRGGILRLLYAGRLTPAKGVHTAVSAMARLRQLGDTRATLAIFGSGEPRYERELHAQVNSLGLAACVRFHAAVPRSQMPHVFAQHDVLLLVSEWEEPFARVVLEAMAAGMVVIGTRTGGTSEILVENSTGLTMSPHDADGLARQIRRLLEEPDLYDRLARDGRRCVQQQFTLDRMVDNLEAVLAKISSMPVEA